MAHIANCTAPKKNKVAWDRKDFIKLSTDKVIEAVVPLDTKQMKEKFGSKFKSDGKK